MDDNSRWLREETRRVKQLTTMFQDMRESFDKLMSPIETTTEIIGQSEATLNAWTHQLLRAHQIANVLRNNQWNGERAADARREAEAKVQLARQQAIEKAKEAARAAAIVQAKAAATAAAANARQTLRPRNANLLESIKKDKTFLQDDSKSVRTKLRSNLKNSGTVKKGISVRSSQTTSKRTALRKPTGRLNASTYRRI